MKAATVPAASEDRYCNAFPDPAVKWRRGVCNLATHQKGNGNGAKPEQKVNPLKASKRAARREPSLNGQRGRPSIAAGRAYFP